MLNHANESLVRSYLIQARNAFGLASSKPGPWNTHASVSLVSHQVNLEVMSRGTGTLDWIAVQNTHGHCIHQSWFFVIWSAEEDYYICRLKLIGQKNSSSGLLNSGFWLNFSWTACLFSACFSLSVCSLNSIPDKTTTTGDCGMLAWLYHWCAHKYFTLKICTDFCCDGYVKFVEIGLISLWSSATFFGLLL